MHCLRRSKTSVSAPDTLNPGADSTAEASGPEKIHRTADAGEARKPVVGGWRRRGTGESAARRVSRDVVGGTAMQAGIEDGARSIPWLSVRLPWRQ